jgi:hypothetical protein
MEALEEMEVIGDGRVGKKIQLSPHFINGKKEGFKINLGLDKSREICYIIMSLDFLRGRLTRTRQPLHMQGARKK